MKPSDTNFLATASPIPGPAPTTAMTGLLDILADMIVIIADWILGQLIEVMVRLFAGDERNFKLGSWRFTMMQDPIAFDEERPHH